MGRHMRAMQLGVLGVGVIVLVVVSVGWKHPPPPRYSSETTARTAPLVGETHGVIAHPGGAAGRPVWQCNSVDQQGRARAGSQLVFHDITSRGWECRRATTLLRVAAARWRGQPGMFRGGRLRCRQLYAEAGNPTIRCWSRGTESVRFTIHAPQSKVRGKSGSGPSVQCGAFRTWFDISVWRVACAEAGDMIRMNGREWDRPQLGRQLRVRGGYQCSVVYAESDQPTYRCVHPRGASIRFTLSNEPVVSVNAYGRAAHHMRQRRGRSNSETTLVSSSARRLDAAARSRSKQLPARLAAKAWLARPDRALTPVAPLVMRACPSFGGWTTITAIGIACDQIQRFVPADSQAVIPQQMEGLSCLWVAQLYRCASSTGRQGFAMRPIDRSD
jgi:hypothetical protein